MNAILVAGIGNIFCGDDGFGVEVVERLAQRTIPDGVRVMDIGIRGVHLAYELLNGYRAAILVDTAQRGEAPGTLSLIEPAVDAATQPAMSAHDLDPAAVLELVGRLGGACPRILVLACEPLSLGGEDGAMGLSPPVAAAIEPALAMLERLIATLLRDDDVLPGAPISAKQPERSLA
ncbi:MAG: hydrogenase maturation protease [Acidisphaera sp.]|nr:hydrogenase maturation protease [Acidisphaera sp.]